MNAPSSITEVLEAACLGTPDAVALVDERRRLTFEELIAGAAALAGEYRARGVTSGERVVCSVSNRVEHVVAMTAAWWAGATHVCADYRATAHELSRIVTLTQARALVYERPDDGNDAVRRLRSDHPSLEILTVDGGLPVTGASAERATVQPDAAAVVFVTSGTTGTPKATIGYHGNLAQRWYRLSGWLRFAEDDVHLAHMPLSHGFGLLTAISALMANGSLVLLDRFSPARALDAVERERVTVIGGAPAHFRLLLSRFAEAPSNVSSLRLGIGTAASFEPELVREIRASLGLRMAIMYGSSEGVGVATDEEDDVLRGAVGRPRPGSVTILAPDGTTLPPGAVGEIAFSRSVFPVRYWGDATPTTPWYHSGDLGRLDEEGRLFVHGRLAHQIDRGGLKIDPVEVELAIAAHGGVADAAVVGVPDPVVGERVCACVVPGMRDDLSLSDLRASLRDVLAPYKLPDDLCVLDEIPRSAIGKVDLLALRAKVTRADRESIRSSTIATGTR